MNKTIADIVKLLEHYSNDYKAIEESNKKCVENIYDFEYAVEVLKRDGNLTDQIKKNEEKLNTLGVNLDLRAENAVSLMSFYEDRKVIEAENKALRTINEVIGNKEPQEMIERIKKAEHELAHTMEKNIEQQEKNIAMIENIKKVCAERIDDLKEAKQDMLDENAVKESKARTLIENMKNLEAEIQKFEMFINAGILTHSQIAHINSIKNRQIDTTKLFAEIVLGRETEEIINSSDMENKYYQNFIKENAEKIEALHTGEKTALLNKVIDDTKIIDNYVKPEIPEIKEEVIEFKKEEVKEEKPKLQIDDAYAKQFPFLFEGLELDEKKQQIPDQESDYFKQFPYIFKGVLDAEKQENQNNDINTFINKPKTESQQPKIEQPKVEKTTKEEPAQKNNEEQPKIFTEGYKAAMDFIREQNNNDNKKTVKEEQIVKNNELSDFMRENSIKKEVPDDEIMPKSEETPVVETEVVPEEEYDTNKKDESPIIDVEPSELKPADEVKDEQPSSLNNYDKSTFDSIFGNENKDTKDIKPENNIIANDNENIHDNLDDKITKAETVDKNSDFMNAINNNQKNDEPKQEQQTDKPKSEDNSISKKITAIKENINNRNQTSQQSTDKEADIIAAAIEKIMNKKSENSIEIEQPKEVPFFSKISKKMKRKKATGERYNDIKNSVEILNREVTQEELNNDNSHVK